MNGIKIKYGRQKKHDAKISLLDREIIQDGVNKRETVKKIVLHI